MFGLSMWELIVIALVVILVVGPKRLPDVAKSIGKGYGEFKRSFNDLKQSVNLNDDISGKQSHKTAERANKIESYSERYKSQWEDKLPEAEPKISKLEAAALNENEEKKG